MTSRERVIKTLEHEQPDDRVAIDFGGTDCSGIALHAYISLKELLNIKTESKVWNLKQGLAEVEPEVRERMGGDLVPLRYYKGVYGIDNSKWKRWKTPRGDECLVGYNFDPYKMPDGSYEIRNGDDVVARMPANGFYFDTDYKYPLRNASSERQVIEYFERDKMGDLSEKADYLKSEAERLYKETDKAIIYRLPGSIFDRVRNLWGFDKGLMNLYDAPQLIELSLDLCVERYIYEYSKILPAIRDFVQIIYFADDLGTQKGLPISPEMYRRFIKPRQAKLIDYIKKNSDSYFMLHSDGAFPEIIPDLIEIGVDILNPLQYNLPGMDAAFIKREYGSYLSFFGGGCETQNILPFGTPDDVREEATKMISILGRGGGYIFCQVHNILSDVPPQNIIALYETARNFRF